MKTRLLISLSLPVTLCLFAGCGGGDKKGGTVHFSGTVMFDGKPIPEGKIYFDPDGSKKNTGASGFATIKDGKYSTKSAGGKATVGGPMVIRIEGFDPSESGATAKSDTSGEKVVKQLFPTYQTNADLPMESGTKDFVVPASAAKRKVKPETLGGSGP